jgi:HlyD family secretion protein
VRALITVSVGSQLSGQISELKADFNSEVKAGDELVVIDDKSFRARVAQGTADLAAARATLAHQAAGLAKAEAIRRNAERLLSRQQALANKGIAAAATLDNALRDFEVAQADVAVARAQVENAKANIAQREAQLAHAQVDLERTRIRSPIDGTVVARTIDVGQTVAASLQAPELFKIAQDLRRIRIEAQVGEADVGSVAPGNAVEFRVDAYPDRRFRGKVAQVRLGGIELNNVVTYAVIIEADNDDRALLPGMTADAKIEAAYEGSALRVPNDALRYRPRGDAAKALARAQAGERLNREFERVKRTLNLSPEQMSRISDAMNASVSWQQNRIESGSAIASVSEVRMLDGEPEWRALQRLVQVIASVATDTQRPAFDAWKEQLETASGRGSRRNVTVWVLDASNRLESRQIDIGIADDHFSEVVSGNLKEGNKLVTRSREGADK